jgi:Fe-S oxidoreductase
MTMTIEDVILTTDLCRYCLMCRHVAPIEHVTHRETLSPHGFALVIASVRRGLLEWNEDSVDVVYSASDNGNSRAHCVFNNPLPEAIAAARAEIAAQGLAPARAYEIDAALQAWGTPFAQQQPRPAEGQGEVALFVGDEAQYLWPQAIPAVLHLLKAAGIEPVLIGQGRSNGFIPSSLGFPDTAREVARANLAELESSGVGRLLVHSPGDTFTFRQLYDERLGIIWPEDIEIEEVTGFLARQLEGGVLHFKRSLDPTPYAYVDPTHAVRAPVRHATPRQLLAAVLPGEARELFWRRERAHPVGSTALQFTHPRLAEQLTLARLEDARDSGARLLVCDDPATLHQLAGGADRFGLRLQGLYELLAEHLDHVST